MFIFSITLNVLLNYLKRQAGFLRPHEKLAEARRRRRIAGSAPEESEDIRRRHPSRGLMSTTPTSYLIISDRLNRHAAARRRGRKDRLRRSLNWTDDPRIGLEGGAGDSKAGATKKKRKELCLRLCLIIHFTERSAQHTQRALDFRQTRKRTCAEIVLKQKAKAR
jgi:hypothetical protein